MGVQRLIIEESVRVVVLNLLVDLAIDLLHNVLAQLGWYLEVLDEGLGEEHRVGNTVMEVPGKSVA